MKPMSVVAKTGGRFASAKGGFLAEPFYRKTSKRLASGTSGGTASDVIKTCFPPPPDDSRINLLRGESLLVYAQLWSRMFVGSRSGAPAFRSGTGNGRIYTIAIG